MLLLPFTIWAAIQSYTCPCRDKANPRPLQISRCLEGIGGRLCQRFIGKDDTGESWAYEVVNAFLELRESGEV